jgi:hypothetical protein
LFCLPWQAPRPFLPSFPPSLSGSLEGVKHGQKASGLDAQDIKLW